MLQKVQMTNKSRNFHHRIISYAQYENKFTEMSLKYYLYYDISNKEQRTFSYLSSCLFPT